MSLYLGIDTSNYTTSAAVFDGKKILHKKQLLPVKAGAVGLKQSDAVFLHTVQLPSLLEQLLEGISEPIQGVCVSDRPRNVKESYMPCFMVGVGAARAVAAVSKLPLYHTSHQVGHILAALYSAGRLDLINRPFLAFHVSGGTTEALLVTPDQEEILHAQCVAKTLDLKAGQGIDRVGVMLGLSFPAGTELDRLACRSVRNFSIRPALKGADCCLSGLENQCRKMFEAEEPPEDIARFAITYIGNTLDAMTEKLREQYGELPLLFAGGVMSNSILRSRFTEKYHALFAEPEFSSDNAAGVAIAGQRKADKL